MDKYERLVAKLKNQEKTVGTTMSMFNNTLILECMNRDDLDFVVYDAEHGIFDIQNAVSMLQVCRLLGIPSIFRAQDAEYHLIAKAIDMGADGVIVPRTETLEQVRTAIDGLYFSPVGRKGCGGHAQFRPGEKFEDFGKTRFLFPQIESRKGIEVLPSILDTYGELVNAVLIGPYDMSVMLGTPKVIGSPVMIEAIQEVFDICHKYGKSCGIFCDDEILAKKYRDMGCNVFWLSTDKDLFMKGYNLEMDALKEF